MSRHRAGLPTVKLQATDRPSAQSCWGFIVHDWDSQPRDAIQPTEIAACSWFDCDQQQLQHLLSRTSCNAVMLRRWPGFLMPTTAINGSVELPPGCRISASQAVGALVNLMMRDACEKLLVRHSTANETWTVKTERRNRNSDMCCVIS